MPPTPDSRSRASTAPRRVAAGLLRWFAVLLCCCCALVPVAPAQAAGKRLALVIGNAAYQGEKPLRNPVNDAQDVATVLQQAGLQVTRHLNLGRTELNNAIDAFLAQAEGADLAVIYYSGHGIQAGGDNYLIPIDARIQSERDVRSEGVRVGEFMDDLEGRRIRHTLLILDACRDNPYRGRARSSVKGLARPKDMNGAFLVAYATADGQTADDGDGRNGTYTAHLLQQLRQPGKSLRDMVEDTQLSVETASGGTQRPKSYGDSAKFRDLYLVASVRPAPAPQPVPQPAPQDLEGDAWALTQRINSLAAYNAFLDEFPRGRFASAARIARSGLTVAVAPPTLRPEPVLPPAAGPGASPGGAIKVGVLHSLSGTMATSERALKDVALMAIDEINAGGGVLGRRLEPVVVDPASNWPLFADKARQLISKDKVAVVFGCWTSVSRKSVLPVFEELNSLLFYPVQYEGEELSKNVFYTGAAPNQQAIPAVEYLMSKDGGSARRFMLLGTDYIYPRTTHKILRAFLRTKGVAEADIVEAYTPFGHANYQAIVATLRSLASQGQKMAVVSTINGESNLAFYRELRNQGLRAADLPVLALSLSEEDLRGVDVSPMVGHLVASNYFMSLKSPANAEFIRKWTDYARAKGLAGHKDLPLTTDTMEATYVGIQLWKAAVEKAGSADTDKVIAAMAGQALAAPNGYTLTMDRLNHHLHKPLYIGEIRADGQFNTVWKTRGPVVAEPWNRYIAGNSGRQNAPVKN